jgi:hypothetical protein
MSASYTATMRLEKYDQFLAVVNLWYSDDGTYIDPYVPAEAEYPPMGVE